MIQSKHPLPSQWNESLVASSGSRLYVDGPTVTYIGAGGGEREAASIRSDHPVPPDVPVYYFEMTVVSAGDKGFIGVGFSTENVNTARLPGWDQGSYGYHGDDGKSFEGSGNGQGTEYGLEYGDSDWIGVIYNQVERTISYTVNGRDQGVAFSNVTDSRLFPTVGMQSSGEQVVVNFGTAKSKPLRGDYNSIVDATRQRLLARVLRTPLTGTVSQTPEHILRTVIVDFLIHNCCSRTAAQVLQSMQHPQQLQVLGPEQRADMQQRQRIMAAVEGGRIRDAMAAADAHAPGCIAANPDVQFKLHLQHFIELVRAVADVAPDGLASGPAEAGRSCNGSADAGAPPAEELRERLEKEALAYSQSALAAACRTPAHMTMLTDALSLLAYPQPHRSPECHLLQLDRRELLAQELNGVLLRHRGQPEWPLLSTMCKQALAVHSELVEAEDLEAVLLPQSQGLDSQGRDRRCGEWLLQWLPSHSSSGQDMHDAPTSSSAALQRLRSEPQPSDMLDPGSAMQTS